MLIKALTLHQPWASVIASGEKTIEYRPWRTFYRGPLLLCAAARKIAGHEHLPRGCAICIVTLYDCVYDSDENIYDWMLRDITPVRQFQVLGQRRIFNVELPADVASKYSRRR